MLAPALAVKDHLKRKEVGRVIVKGIEIRRPIYLCSRKGDEELSTNLNHFIEFVKNSSITE